MNFVDKISGTDHILLAFIRGVHYVFTCMLN